MKKFLPIILGSDLNTYSIAREIHEAYGIKSVVATSAIFLPCIDSEIIKFYKKKNFSKDREVFSNLLNKIYYDYKDSSNDFIIFCPDDYMRNFLITNLDLLDFNPKLPYANIDVINSIKTKDEFNQKIAHLDLVPQTILANEGSYKDIDYPENVFIKADDDVFYKKLDFDGWQKGYHSKSKEQTIKILENIFSNGYDKNMMVQEFVAGGDGSEFSIDGYRSKSTFSMSACKNVMLDKRPDWVGNFVAKIDTDQEILYDYAKSIVESIGLYGLFNIDFKKDTNTGKIYAFEINLRQGRCHYYATQNGVNLSKIAIEDLIFDNQMEIIGDKPFAYYNLDLDQTLENMADDLKEEFTSPVRFDNCINPLVYDKDWNRKRSKKIEKYLDKLGKETFVYTEIQ